jgi:hypothetical protein
MFRNEKALFDAWLEDYDTSCCNNSCAITSATFSFSDKTPAVFTVVGLLIVEPRVIHKLLAYCIEALKNRV